MKKELQEEIFKKYPLLFGDKDKPMYETCMCWGLDVGDGWYKLVDDLASKLESMIKEFIKQNPDTPCRYCNCKKEYHFAYRSNRPGKCLNVKKIALWTPWNKSVSFFRIFENKNSNKFKTKINSLSYKAIDFPFRVFNKVRQNLAYLLKIFVHRYQACYCEKYEAIHPRASQVKEKYGGLRFYMTDATEEMYALIEEAEQRSYKICDRCGNPGQTTKINGWIHTGCKECLKVEKKKIFRTSKIKK